MESQENTLQKALEGDINAFQSLFAEYQDALKSYLFRLLASRADADDLTHDTFIKAFDALSSFKGKSSLKTWTFSIATNLALNYLKKRQRWTEDVSERAKKMVLARPDLAAKIENIAHHSPYGQYTIREHINTCFTCISKNLPIENQIVLILKDVYDFSVKEIMVIMTKTEGVVKYLLQNGRKTMTDIFDKRCALVNKKGACHQCSELNGWFNPKQDQQEALLQIKLVKAAKKQDKAALYTLRSKLVKAIDPLKSAGNELQEILLACNRMAMEGGE
ncbi:MAG: RNA polymerase sigma factor [Thermonemataceae bacterium]